MLKNNSGKGIFSRRLIFGTTISAALIFITLGIIFSGGFIWSLEATNTEAFCISCHEMKDNVYEEYTETIHFSNRTGVRATCADCHVPKDLHHKVIRKIHATNELYHKLLGTIDTPEKYETKRHQLAQNVWKTMEENDSRECRNCHDLSQMDTSSQKDHAAKQHAQAHSLNKTCIDCHKGIAHKLSEQFMEIEHEKYIEADEDCNQCHLDI
jgi:cytochrome c-type protein NapC